VSAGALARDKRDKRDKRFSGVSTSKIKWKYCPRKNKKEKKGKIGPALRQA